MYEHGLPVERHTLSESAITSDASSVSVLRMHATRASANAPSTTKLIGSVTRPRTPKRPCCMRHARVRSSLRRMPQADPNPLSLAAHAASCTKATRCLSKDYAQVYNGVLYLNRPAAHSVACMRAACSLQARTHSTADASTTSACRRAP